MTESDFIAELSSVLGQHSDAVRIQLPLLLASLPERATRLEFQVFPAEDGDGFFTIRASVDGPDLYVINKSIDAHAQLFDARYTETGIEPPIPTVDPFDVDWPVNDVVVDCAAQWLRSIWQSLDAVVCRIPVVIIGHDDFGTVTPIELNSGSA